MGQDPVQKNKLIDSILILLLIIGVILAVCIAWWTNKRIF